MKTTNLATKALKECFSYHLDQNMSKEQLSKLYKGWSDVEIVPDKPIYDIWLDACISERNCLLPVEFIKYCGKYLSSNLYENEEGKIITDWLV